jgi:LysM repeat protein
VSSTRILQSKMEPETACPVCKFEHISVDRIRCPQCDADLSCFNVLNSLPDELSTEKTGSGNHVVFFVGLGLFFCLTGAMLLFQHYWFKRLGTRILDLQTSLLSSKTNQDTIEREAPRQNPAEPKDERIAHSDVLLEDPEGMPDAAVHTRKTNKSFPVKTPEAWKDQQERDQENPTVPQDIRESNGFWIYEANEKDTLWGIAEKYYGHGMYYPVLLEHNPYLDIYNIDTGTTLKILEERSQAKEIFEEITERNGSRLFWHYTVTDGDTLKAIANRFYKTEDMLKRITELNQDINLEPGDRIKIVLE